MHILVLNRIVTVAFSRRVEIVLLIIPSIKQLLPKRNTKHVSTHPLTLYISDKTGDNCQSIKDVADKRRQNFVKKYSVSRNGLYKLFN